MAYKTTMIMLTLWGITSLVQGQATLPPEGRSQPRVTRGEKLSREARQFARDYHAVLEDISDVYSDYADYFRDMESPQLDKISASLEKTGRGLDRGVYNADPTGLKTEMETLARLCAQFEKVAGHSAPERKALKLSRTLENDLEQLLFDVEEVVDELKEFSAAETTSIGRYISDSLSATADINIDIDKLTRQVEQLARLSAKLAGKATEHVLDSLAREMERAYAEFEKSKRGTSRSHPRPPRVVVIPEIPESPDRPVPPVPDVAPVPVIIGGQSVVLHSGDEVLVTSQLQGTITLSRRQMPVKIISPYGNVIVRGVGGRTVSASCDITVASRTEREATLALKEIGLSTTSPDGSAEIILQIPQFHNPKTRLASSDMVIDAPEGCALTIESRFGSVEVTDIREGVTIHGDHSQIQVENCGGALAIDNTMGEIRVEGFRGPVSVENSHARIALNDIRGDVTVRNSFALTSVVQSRGTVTLICKGEIQIDDHRGDAIIENATASTAIHTLVGDIKLTNSFGSVVISGIEGNVQAQSSSGSVNVENIEGSFIVESRGGHVAASDIGGRLQLTNIDGSADVELNIPLREASTIESTRGRVSVRLAEEADVHVKVRSTRGSVRGPGQLRVVERGSIISADGDWGAGNTTLTITGEDAAFQISEN